MLYKFFPGELTRMCFAIDISNCWIKCHGHSIRCFFLCATSKWKRLSFTPLEKTVVAPICYKIALIFYISKIVTKWFGGAFGRAHPRALQGFWLSSGDNPFVFIHVERQPILWLIYLSSIGFTILSLPLSALIYMKIQ